VTSEFSEGAATIDRTSPLPLWAQLEAELRRRLGLGHFELRFPTDRELIEIYEVSRHTARHAVAKLGSDGIVKRERGIGTSIDRHQFEQSLGSLYSLFQLVERSGVEQRSRVLELERATHAEAAAQLGLAADAPLLHLSRLRLAADEPLAIDRLWLPFEIGEPLLDVDFSHTALYDELERAVGHRPSNGWERIRPVVPPEADRILLGLDGGEAVFSLQRLGMIDSRPIEWRITLIRGDRFSFVADWSAGQRSGLRLARAG
jgi:GntR family transcriptional regulator